MHPFMAGFFIFVRVYRMLDEHLCTLSGLSGEFYGYQIHRRALTTGAAMHSEVLDCLFDPNSRRQMLPSVGPPDSALFLLRLNLVRNIYAPSEHR